MVSATALSAADHPQYVLVEAGTLTGRTDVQLVDLNEQGQIVGQYRVGSSNWQPVLWDQGIISDLALPDAQNSANVYGINAAGTVVGSSSRDDFGAATVWQDGTPSYLFPDYEFGSVATAINDRGDIAGYRYKANTNTAGFSIISGTETEFYATAVSTRPNAIGPTGLIVGNVQTTSESRSLGFRHSGSTSFELGFDSPVRAGATAVNPSGMITGSGSSSDFEGTHAFRYHLEGGLRVIEDLHPPGALQSAGLAIAADNTVFGTAGYEVVEFTTGGFYIPNIAMLLDGADSVPLSELTIGDDNAILADIHSMNDAGWLLVEGPFDTTGATPVPANHVLIPRTAATSLFSNVSVRAQMTPGQTLIVGTASAGGSHDVLVRSVGPGLEPYVTAGTPLTANPSLTVFDADSTSLATNDDWDATGTTAAATTTVQAFPLTPGSADAAVVAAIDGPATAHAVTASGNGLGLVELYSTDTSDSTRRLVNLSARYEVGTGSDVLIAGFIIKGTGPKTVLIRGIGPGLSAHGVTGVLSDPQITLFNSDGQALATNDDWSDNLGSVFAAAGAFELEAGSKDAALVLPLWPGLYTVHLGGVDGATGQGLIEVYDLDL